MKVILSVFIFSSFILPIQSQPLKAASNSSYCVMNAHDQSILSSDNQTHVQSVASISKVMSAIVAIEHASMDELVLVSDIVDEARGSMLYIQKGETYILKDLLFGLLLRSGNDAALLIAQHVSGSVPAFVALMNEKAQQLNMKDTHFNNPSGLDEEDGGNASSSCDMALLTSYALYNKTFAKMSVTKTYSPFKGVYWRNKNRFLFTYPYATGGKTGFTKKAGRTLITTSKKKGREVVVVTLNVGDDFAQHELAHTWAYDTFSEVIVLAKGIYRRHNAFVSIDEDVSQVVEKGSHARIETHTSWNEKTFKIRTKYKKFINTKNFEVTYE